MSKSTVIDVVDVARRDPGFISFSPRGYDKFRKTLNLNSTLILPEAKDIGSPLTTEIILGYRFRVDPSQRHEVLGVTINDPF